MHVQIIKMHEFLPAVIEYRSAVLCSLCRVFVNVRVRGLTVPFAIIFAMITSPGQYLIECRHDHQSFFPVVVGPIIGPHAGMLHGMPCQDG